MVEKKIIETIREYNMISEGQHIVIGLSGGPDSVCLFDVLDTISKEWNLKLHPVHVNHKFRPGDAEADEAYTIDLCKSRGLQCKSVAVDCGKMARELKITSEEAGRIARYRAFSQVAEELINQGVLKENIRIAVAQNSDDLAETVLFRILRGTGTDGLSGISYVRRNEDGILIIRPLMDVYKREVTEYCQRKNLNPCIDKTNLKPLYSRNKIRLQLIPYIEEHYNPNIKGALCRLARSASEDRQFLRQLAREAFDENLRQTEQRDGEEYSFLLNGDGLRKLHNALRRRVFAYGFDRLGLQGDISFSHYKGMEEILDSESPSAAFDLPHGYRIVREYDNVRLCRPKKIEKMASIDISIMEKSKYDEYTTKYIEARKGKQLCGFFDYERLIEEYGDNVLKLINIRGRMAGDYISLGVGRKKIQNLLVDMKIPKAERDNIRLVGIGPEILMVCSREKTLRFSTKYKVLSSTKTVICIEI